ncbi:unnamed protein product [Eruca vesicaria subsp. sativa]|uniref:Uncharacterized protein n=1 Tax=Eruca vesicaria subsp. sativa TaxID=29727 RepID=A0ABC8JPW4_ERUVS|nr:unnamed protein product [Eruca vesicaria subsp. sativa]
MLAVKTNNLSVTRNEMVQVLMASYHQVIGSDMSIGAHQSVITLGVEHRLDPHLWLKSWIANSTGQVNVICQWYFLRVIGEFSHFHISRMGLGIALSF